VRGEGPCEVLVLHKPPGVAGSSTFCAVVVAEQQHFLARHCASLGRHVDVCQPKCTWNYFARLRVEAF
jgi:hypothetical protein